MPWRNDGSSGRNTPRQRGVLARLHSVSCHCQLTPVVPWLLFLDILAWNPRNKDLALQGTNNGISRDIANIARRGDSSKKINQKHCFFLFIFSLRWLSPFPILISERRRGCDAVLIGLAWGTVPYDIPTDSILPSVSLWHVLCRTKYTVAAECVRDNIAGAPPVMGANGDSSWLGERHAMRRTSNYRGHRIRSAFTDLRARRQIPKWD